MLLGTGNRDGGWVGGFGGRGRGGSVVFCFFTVMHFMIHSIVRKMIYK